MDVEEILRILDELIPQELAIENDNIGYFSRNQERKDVDKIKILMDFLPEFEEEFETTDLIITHHPPLFRPIIPTFVIHSNWDIIEGGANDALVDYLELTSYSVLDKETGIGRLCESNISLSKLKKLISNKFPNNPIKIVNDKNKKVKKIAIVSGYGLSDSNLINLAKSSKADVYISGDLTHKNAILAKKLDITLIEIPHHTIEWPGLVQLSKLISENSDINLPVELIDKGVPWSYI